jgi:FixJ family two-component response regulator
VLSKQLTDMEREVLCRIGDGLNDEEIADVFGIGRTAAQKLRTHILTKLVSAAARSWWRLRSKTASRTVGRSRSERRRRRRWAKAGHRN